MKKLERFFKNDVDIIDFIKTTITRPSCSGCKEKDANNNEVIVKGLKSLEDYKENLLKNKEDK